MVHALVVTVVMNVRASIVTVCSGVFAIALGVGAVAISMAAVTVTMVMTVLVTIPVVVVLVAVGVAVGARVARADLVTTRVGVTILEAPAPSVQVASTEAALVHQRVVHVTVAVAMAIAMLAALAAVAMAMSVVDVDAGHFAPLVVNILLAVKLVVGAPVVPRVVNPLVVALTLMTGLPVGFVATISMRLTGGMSVIVVTVRLLGDLTMTVTVVTVRLFGDMTMTVATVALAMAVTVRLGWNVHHDPSVGACREESGD